MVTEWIDSFPLTAYISDTMDHIYPDPPAEENTDRIIEPRYKGKDRKGGLWTEMIDGESHSNYSECSIRWKIGHHTSTTLQMVVCKSRGRGECYRFARNRRENDYIIQGISPHAVDSIQPYLAQSRPWNT